jgi:prepilin-type N-terminal cleavage/methylation domain-containing protein
VPVLRGFSRSAKQDSEASHRRTLPFLRGENGTAPRPRFLRRHSGFTLVEVIVVIVIIAILAAIGVPALTGYIDKAATKKIEMQVKTQVTAFQSMLDIYYAEEGGFTAYGFQNYYTSQNIFGRVQSLNMGGYPYYTLFWLTEHGLDEYQKLTGDMESFVGSSTVNSNNIQDKDFQEIYADSSGTILFYSYRNQYYYDASEEPFLWVMYIPDIDSANPVTQGRINAYFTNLANAKAQGLTSGINVFKRYNSPGDSSLARFEKLD